MNILTTGSRNWDDRESIWRIMDDVAGNSPVHVVHGDCHIDGQPAGADRWVQEWAEHRARVRKLPTTWQRFRATARYGPWPARGPRRSEDMVKKFKASRVAGDRCLVFYVDRDVDRGTRACHELIKQYKMFPNTYYYSKEVTKNGNTQDRSDGNRGQGQAPRMAS